MGKCLQATANTGLWHRLEKEGRLGHGQISRPNSRSPPAQLLNSCDPADQGGFAHRVRRPLLRPSMKRQRLHGPGLSLLPERWASRLASILKPADAKPSFPAGPMCALWHCCLAAGKSSATLTRRFLRYMFRHCPQKSSPARAILWCWPTTSTSWKIPQCGHPLKSKGSSKSLPPELPPATRRRQRAANRLYQSSAVIHRSDTFPCS